MTVNPRDLWLAFWQEAIADTDLLARHAASGRDFLCAA